MRRFGSTTLAALPFLVLAACGEEPETRVAMESPPAATSPAESTTGLTPEQIAQLREKYPVLGEERAPEPKPSERASPGQVPERFQGALPERVLETASGEATFYADKFEGMRTASGVPFRQNQMVAAHRGYPFGTLLRVTNLRNDNAVNVRVVDRGPFGSAQNRGAILDLSRRAAERLGYINAGRAQVSVEVLEWGEGIASG